MIVTIQYTLLPVGYLEARKEFLEACERPWMEATIWQAKNNWLYLKELALEGQK